MKKVLPFVLVAAAFALIGCSSTQETSTANTPMTLDQALQKSSETRQKVQDAKSSSASSSSSSSSTAIKDSIQSNLDAQKAKVDAEKQAWKDALK